MPEAMRLNTSFEVQLGNPILEGLVAVGRLDGKTLSLVAATSNNRIIVHTPDVGVRTLNFGRATTAIACGAMGDGKESEGAEQKVDALLVGSESSLLSYNVERNSEYFFKNVEDGVGAICYGKVVDGAPPFAIVGGNCSVYGYDASGSEQYWTVTGEMVSAMSVMPWWKGESRGALVSASDDFEIRVFNGEDVAMSMMEVDRVTSLTYSNTPGRFAYLLQNGTVGVYEQSERLWRFKGKNRPVSVAYCDVDFDGVEEMIVGWEDGRVEVRSGVPSRKGECMYKTTFDSAIRAVISADYRETGKTLPLVCTSDGVVRGLIAIENTVEEVVESVNTQLLDELVKEKKAEETQLASLQEQLVRLKKGTVDVTMPAAATRLKAALQPNFTTGMLDVVLTVSEGSSDVVIQSAVLRSEEAFAEQDGAVFFYATKPAATLICSLPWERNVQCEIHVSSMVGLAYAEACQVYESKITVPQFVMCAARSIAEKSSVMYATPNGTSSFRFDKPADRIGKWLSKFMNANVTPPLSATDSRKVNFVDARSKKCISVQFEGPEEKLTLFADDMETCAELMQSICTECNFEDVTAECSFPAEMEKLEGLLGRITEYTDVRSKLSAEIAESTGVVKVLVVKAEDARILGEMGIMRRMYGSLYDMNKELMGEHLKRLNNHTELLSALKQVNAMIQNAGRLRFGPSKSAVISACREAMKQKNHYQLIKVMQSGVE